MPRPVAFPPVATGRVGPETRTTLDVVLVVLLTRINEAPPGLRVQPLIGMSVRPDSGIEDVASESPPKIASLGVWILTARSGNEELRSVPRG